MIDRSVYQEPLVSRYTSREMQEPFSEQFKFTHWRRCWVALAEAQHELGLKLVTREMVEELRAHIEDIDYEVAAQKEKEIRHDVMAHVYAYGLCCPKAEPIIHLGATSQFVVCNTDLLIQKKGLALIKKALVNVIANLATFCARHAGLATLGDRMLPVDKQRLESYVPKRPSSLVEARVISIYDGVRYGGGGQIITLSRATNDGLTVGDVLQLWRLGETRLDRTAPGREFVKLPDEQVGLAFVFRVFPTISYALIQRVTMPVEVGDRASNPGDNLSVNVNVPRETEADRVLRQPLRPLNIQ